MKIMARKISACLMPLLLFFYLAMSPVALANDTGENVNMVTLDGGMALNALGSFAAAKTEKSPRSTSREIFPGETKKPRETKKLSFEKEKWWLFEKEIYKIKSKQECPAEAEKYCQSKYGDDSPNAVNCRRYFLTDCQEKFRGKIGKEYSVEDFINYQRIQ